MPLPPDIQQRIQKAKANGFTDAQIQADMQRKYGVGLPDQQLQLGQQKPESLLGSNKVADFMGGITGGKQVAKLGASVAFMGGKENKGAISSQQQLDQLTQKYVKETLAKYPPGDPRRERALKIAGTGYSDTSNYQQNLSNTGPNGREVAADIGKLALTGIGLKVPANFAGKLGLTRSVAANMGLGGASGALNAVEAGKGGRDIGTAALTSGLTAGAIRGITGLTGRAFGKLTNDVPESIYKTSTQVPRNTNVKNLLKEGVVGNRSQLASKAKNLVSEAQKKIEATPGIKDSTATVDDILSYGPLQKLREKAQRIGELEAVDRAISKVLPKSTQSIDDALLAAESGANPLSSVKGPIDTKKIAELFRLKKAGVKEVPGSFSLLEALKQKSAIDEFTPQGVFSDRSTAITGKAEGEVADALRSLVHKNPQISSGLKQQAPAQALLSELNRYQNAKTGQVPGSLGSIAQRTIFTPGVATRLAGIGYKLGGGGRTLSGNKGQQLLKVLQVLLRGGIGTGFGK